jgi:DNA-binding MarR family transcriptional regulator
VETVTSDPAGTGDAIDAIVARWRAERPDIDPAPMAVFGRIYRIASAAGSRMERVYAQYGIGRGEFDVLAALRRAGAPFDLSPGHLADTLMLTTGGMTGRLDKLERAGLVERRADQRDRRALRVVLTDRGRKTIDDAVVAGLDAQHEMLARLGAQRSEQLADLLCILLGDCS